MRIVNLTPHPITLAGPDGVRTTISAQPTPCRVSSTPGQRLAVESAPCALFDRTTFGEVENLPAPAADTIYVVSRVVAAALRGSRDDVFVPGTGPADGAIRDGQGHIEAITRLVRD